MESLEDMLAALEGPTSGEQFGNDLDNISNIDEFLDQIEEEARMSTKTRQTTNSELDEYGYVPPAGRGQVHVHTHTQAQPQRSPPVAQGGRGQPQRPQMPSVSQPQRAQAPSNAPPMRQQSPTAQPMRQPAPSNVPPMRTQTPTNAPPMQRQNTNNAQPMRPQNNNNGGQRPAGLAGVGSATAELEQQGYERHNNSGKWINYTGGKATDFRIKGTTSSRVGLSHVITLRALDDFGNPARVDNPREFIGCVLTHTQSGSGLQCWYRDNGNCEYDLAFCPDRPGSVRMEIKLAGNPMFDIEIQVEDLGTSLWAAKPRLPAKPRELFIIDIETVDGSRPEGVAPFEVQTVGSVENLRLINNGDGTYRFQCIPQSHGHITIQLTLHGQPIKNSPVTVQVGDRQPMKIRQESTHEETISDTRVSPGTGYNANNTYEAQAVEREDYGNGEYDQYGGGYVDGYQRDSTDVSNEDLNRLLDELGG